MKNSTCNRPECETPPVQGYVTCPAHLKKRPALARPIKDRFWSKVEKDPAGGCWEWTGAKYKSGYGMLQVNGRNKVRAHRLAYEMFVGPIPEGLFIDHFCRNRACVNPDHLRIATNKQNMENQAGRGSSTGHRNVYRAATGRYFVSVHHNGRSHYGGTFVELERAVESARALRCQLFTHNVEGA